MTLKQRVLAELRAHPEGVCVSMLPQELGYTSRNRVSELRRDGLPIEGSRCTRHPHKAPVYSYRLVSVGQQTLVMS